MMLDFMNKILSRNQSSDTKGYIVKWDRAGKINRNTTNKKSKQINK